MKSLNVKLTKQHSSMQLNISLEAAIVLPLVFSVGEFLERFKEWLGQASKEILERFLQELDRVIFADLKLEGVVIADYKDRSLATSLAKLFFRYRQVKDKGKYYSPLLDFLGIPPRVRIIEEACEGMIKGCLFTSFRKALAWGGGGVSLGTLWNRFQQRGEKVRQKEKDAVGFFTEGAISPGESPYTLALVMLDGIWMRKAAKRKKKRRSGHFELKSARLSFGRLEKGEWHWTAPVVYANNCSSKTFLRQCSDFFNAVYGLHRAPHILVVSDAASWIKKFCDFYPGQAVWQLDWWHLWKKVKTLHFFGDDVYREAWDLLMVERLDDALSVIRKAKCNLEKFMALKLGGDAAKDEGLQVFKKREKKWLERRHKEIDELLTYIENNRDSIYGVKALPKEIPAEALYFGSGPIEKLQGTLFGYRMKKQGKSWSPKGAYHMSGLLAQWYNGEKSASILQDLYEQKLLWNEENERLEEGGNWLSDSGYDVKKMPFSPFNTHLPIVSRGKKDTGMFDLLQGIKNFKRPAA